MAEILGVEGLSAGYGAATTIADIGFSLGEGQALAVLGRNGTGKTTLLTTLVGLTTRKAGVIRLDGREITGLKPEARAAAGIGWVPQERAIFRSLSVEENLTAVARPGRWTPEGVYSLFPRLGERRKGAGETLSGGEQQMLAIGRALVLNPRVMLLDEPLEGLAPIIVADVLFAVQRIVRDRGTAVIIVEQKARVVLDITDQAIILDRGRIVHRAKSAELLADATLLDAHLSVRERRGQRRGRPG